MEAQLFVHNLRSHSGKKYHHCPISAPSLDIWHVEHPKNSDTGIGIYMHQQLCTWSLSHSWLPILDGKTLNFKCIHHQIVWLAVAKFEGDTWHLSPWSLEESKWQISYHMTWGHQWLLILKLNCNPWWPQVFCYSFWATYYVSKTTPAPWKNTSNMSMAAYWMQLFWWQLLWSAHMYAASPGCSRAMAKHLQLFFQKVTKGYHLCFMMSLWLAAVNWDSPIIP